MHTARRFAVSVPCPMFLLALLVTSASAGTQVTLSDCRWHLNGKVTAAGSPAEGLLMNVRMVNAVFEDRNRKDFDAKANTDEFIQQLPVYVSQGVSAFTVGLQGGMPNYEGALNSAFEPDGTLRAEYMERVRSVITACDAAGAVVILSCFYQRQDQVLKDEDAIRAAVVNVARWLREQRFTNVIVEITNEYGHGGFQHELLRQHNGQVELIKLFKKNAPGFLVSTSSTKSGYGNESVAEVGDFILTHLNNLPTTKFGEHFRALRKCGKAIVCNEDAKTGVPGRVAAETCVGLGVSWGLMADKVNQDFPFEFRGAEDDPEVYRAFKRLTTPNPTQFRTTDYFPPPDSRGGWRRGGESASTVDAATLDGAFGFIQGSTRNGGLLVVHRGRLVYERYFGLAGPDTAPNLASCAKSFTSVCTGILMSERRDLFPDGLEQKAFLPELLPDLAFPLTDDRKKEITLGQLLAFSAGIRGNNPSFVNRRPVTVEEPGPDGVGSMIDAVALGREGARQADGRVLSTGTLWCDPGQGYSYATSSISIAGIMIRHLTGRELDDYVQTHLAAPLGWQHWGWGYKNSRSLKHIPGGGGIAVRPTDMLRFGYLLLRKGRWEDRQLIPPEYVAAATSQSKYNPHSPYSLQFDVNTDGDIPDLPRDAFWKGGSGGHVLYVVPSLDLVVWKLGGRDGQYSKADTGLVPGEAASADARDGWKETVDSRTATVETLKRVIAAVKTP